MKQNKSIAWNILISIFFALLIATFAFSVYKFTRHADPTEIAIFSAKNYAADKPVSIILFARDAVNKTPLSDQNIEVSVNGKAISSIKTKEDGTALLILKKYPKNLVVEARIGERVVKKYIGVGKYKDDTHKIIKKVKFKTKPEIQFQTDKSFYAPGETIKGVIKSKLPAKTKIEIKSSLTFRVLEPIKKNDDSMFGPAPRECIRQQVNYKTIKAVRNSNGCFKFQLKLPKEFTKIDFKEEDSVCELSINTSNGSKQKLTKKITITNRPIRIKYLPEYFNSIYVFVSTPDGKPCVATVRVTGQSGKTDKNGLVSLRKPLIRGQNFCIDAIVEGIGEATKIAKKRNDIYFGSLLFKTNKLIYNSGDKINLDFFAFPLKRFSHTPDFNVFVNIAKGHESLKIFSVKLKDDKASYMFEIPDDVFGLIQIRACRILPNGELVRSLRIIQVNRSGGKHCFASSGQMLRARFKSPVNADFENVRGSNNNNWEKKACSSYDSRNGIFTRGKTIYGEILFFVSLVVLFSIFLVVLISFMRLWFYPSKKDCVLIVSKQLSNRVRNNIVFVITGFIILIITLFFIDKLCSSQIEDLVGNSIPILYIVFFGSLLYRSFYLRNLLLKVPSGESGDRVKKSLFLLPYLLLIFILFEHVYLLGLMFLKNTEWIILLVCAFQVLAFIWLFCAWGINNFIYSQDEYNARLQYESRLGTGFGAGLGAYPNSFCKLWICSGFIYWGIPVFIYFLVVIIIISLFLPLTRIIEKLG